MVLTIKKQLNGSVFDEEDLSYGPGIVSKLRCRYMNLTLKEPLSKFKNPNANVKRFNNNLDMAKEKDPNTKQTNEVFAKSLLLSTTTTRRFPAAPFQSKKSKNFDASELPPNVVRSKLHIFEPQGSVTKNGANQKPFKSIVEKDDKVVQNTSENNQEIHCNLSGWKNNDNVDSSEDLNHTVYKLETTTVKPMYGEKLKTDRKSQLNGSQTLTINLKDNFECKRKTTKNEASTIVFNFTNRYNIPDHVSFGRVADVFKFNQSMDVSTIFDNEDEEDTLSKFKFQNSNIIIGGKSNLKSTDKSTKCKLSFNDSLTSIFEYPSEESYLEENDQKDTLNEMLQN